MDLEAAILNILASRSGLKASDVTKIINDKYSIDVDKSEVNSLLYGKLKNSVVRDENYKWSLKSDNPIDNSQVSQASDSLAVDAPMCPNCGLSMVMRTARRGSKAGSAFWGCSNFPICRGTINIGAYNDQSYSRQSVETYHTTTDYAQNNVELPLFLQARERHKDYQVRFFQTIAIPQSLIKQINQGKIERQKFNRLNQWRLDYPQNTDAIENRYSGIFAMANKILTRGRITLTSPYIEDACNEYYNKNHDPSYSGEFNFLKGFLKSESKDSFWLDGYEAEKIFYEQILPELLGPNYHTLVIPQVFLSSLIGESCPESMQNQRIDFLITLPGESIAVELDGVENHEGHEDRDRSRDNILRDAGFDVIRINNSEIINGYGRNLERLQEILTANKTTEKVDFNTSDKMLITLKLIHQIEVSIIEAAIAGFILEPESQILVDIETSVLSDDDIDFLIMLAQDDLNELIYNISVLYGWDADIVKFHLERYSGQQQGAVITYNGNLPASLTRFIIEDITFPRLLSQYSRSNAITSSINPKIDVLEFFLNYIFRKEKFLEGQYETISRALTGKDTIVLLPTGGGKSIAFQLSALLLPGVSIVIDPIISLIDDQIENLARAGIDRIAGITSDIALPATRSEIIRKFGLGEYLLCYIAPERFQTEEFRNAIKMLTVSTAIPLVAVDESHCVSEWGHDFRTSYLNIARTSRNCCKFRDRPPCILGLTGTASNAVLKDVQRELQIYDYEAIITPKTFDRKELHYYVVQCRSEEKMNVLMGLLQKYLPDKFNRSYSSFFQLYDDATNCGIVFCPNVGGKYGVVELAGKLAAKANINAKYYAGKAPRNWESERWKVQKKKNASDFKNNYISLLVATKAFGMGIDKPNIRYTIHYGIPASIESFYQEAGRAGRDRKRSECLIILSNDDRVRTKKLLDVNQSIEEISRIMDEERSFETDDDITRIMYFHINSFRGIENEMGDIERVASHIFRDGLGTKQINIVVPDMERNRIEKAIHRLLILGVVEDYTLDYSSDEFQLYLSRNSKQDIIDNYARYVAGYNKSRVLKEVRKMEAYSDLDYLEFMMEACRVLVSFIYETIEKGRRRALNEMLAITESAASSYDSDTVMRERILRYLEYSYTEEIEKILDSEDIGFSCLKEMIDGYETTDGEIVGGLRSPKDAAEIRGQVSRYLESFPDHPGLLLLRALSELYCTDYDLNAILQNIKAAIKFSSELYGVEESDVYDILAWMMNKAYERSVGIYQEIIPEIFTYVDGIFMAKALLYTETNNEDILYEPALCLFHHYSEVLINKIR